MQKLFFQLFLIIFFLFSVFTINAQTTRYVDGINGNNNGGSNDCSNSGSPCATITHAVNMSDFGDIVRIAPAEYTEVLFIDKSISLEGTDQTNTIIQAHTQPNQATNRVITLSEFIEVTISDVTIRHGNATVGGGYPYKAGGGIYVQNASLTMFRVLFYRNKADQQGGGMSTRHSEVELNSVSFIENESNNDGGAIVNYNVVNQKLTNVSFINNSSISNGSGTIFNTSTSTIEIVNALFYGNTGASVAGCIVLDPTSSINVTNAVFYGNVCNSSFSSGVLSLFAGSSSIFTNTIFWENSGGTANDIAVAQNTTAELYNCLYDNTDPNSIVVQGNGQFLCENCVYNNPQFLDPQNLDFSLQENSVAINAGDPDIDLTIFPVDEQNIPVDLADNPRVVGGIIDIGPYEFQGTNSINDIEVISNVKMFPNPVNNLLYINSGVEIKAITIYDIIGREVKAYDFRKKSSENLTKDYVIDFTDLFENVYIIEIKSITGVETYKIIKK